MLKMKMAFSKFGKYKKLQQKNHSCGFKVERMESSYFGFMNRKWTQKWSSGWKYGNEIVFFGGLAKT
jgi:hypothetical protein